MELQPPQVYVKETGTGKGRGAFAARPFQEGEVVERSPVVTFTKLDSYPMELQRIAFAWSYIIDETGDVHAFALGYASMYNHSNPANLRYTADPANHVLVFTAVRRIEADEELTINYNSCRGEPVSEEDNWFEDFEVTIIR
ncbi:MAG TPA: SET domain-containing protein-lysine N-methyltransferase [Lysobacter sp.]